MDTSAKGLRVVVTAGAAGIGRAIARTFRDHGAEVQVCDVDDQALAKLDQDIQTGKHISGQAISVCGGVRYMA